MRAPQAKAASLRGNELRRVLKRLRDGDGSPKDLASAAVRLVASVPDAAVARAVRELGMDNVLASLRSRDAEAVAMHSPAYQPDAQQAEGTLGSASADDHQAVSGPVVRLTSDGQARRPRARPVREFRTLTADEVTEIHWALVEDFLRTSDPIDPPGVKSQDMLESAVARQFTSLGGEPKYKTLAHMGASLFYGLALNHPFHNGNKRTALVSLICLADTNDLAVTASQDDLYAFVLRVVNHDFRPRGHLSASAALDAEIESMAGWIRPRMRRKEHFDRTIRWRELKSALRQLDVRTERAGSSQVELVRADLRTVVDFDGDTREVGKQVVRKIRKDLKLTPRDGCDDDVFYGDSLPLDHFIAEYRGLLGRLAHV